MGTGATVSVNLTCCQLLQAKTLLTARPIKHNSGLSNITSRPRFLRVAFNRIRACVDYPLQAPRHSSFSVTRLIRFSPMRLGGPPWRLRAPWRIVQRWRLLEICPAEWCMFMYDSPVVGPAREHQLEMVP